MTIVQNYDFSCLRSKGLFTLLLEDFGAVDVQVKEIYEVQKPIEGPGKVAFCNKIFWRFA